MSIPCPVERTQIELRHFVSRILHRLLGFLSNRDTHGFYSSFMSLWFMIDSRSEPSSPRLNRDSPPLVIEVSNCGMHI